MTRESGFRISEHRLSQKALGLSLVGAFVICLHKIMLRTLKPLSFLRLHLVASTLILGSCWCHGEDWTVNKKVYHNIKVIRVTSDAVTVTYDGGAGRLNLSDLSPELRARFVDDAKEAKASEAVERKADTDPIAHLVVRLSSTSGIWANGASVMMPLASTLSPEELALSSLKKWGFPKKYEVVKVEHVQIDDSSPESAYTAVLVHNDLGDKIVLLHYLDNHGWWSRVYDSTL